MADRLTPIAPCDLSRVYFTSGGWEGTESALKMARQYFAEKDEPDRGHTITRQQSYPSYYAFGAELNAVAASAQRPVRATDSGLGEGEEHVYRHSFAGRSGERKFVGKGFACGNRILRGVRL
ncbi:MAG: aminotransferase class III-fold pyridoxal phosphate-dependent enzyme [Rhodospirillaceae bacterium TMED63]|nr:MAG: aminotransferase class III-fold pyridoxal phosphate-dependent enzyme [Rhodospirillaceae bacterium TMED63]